MKDIYELLNDIDVDGIEYIEMETNEVEKQKYKRNFRKAVKAKNKGYKKSIAVAAVVILSSSIMLSNNVWAYVESIWHTIDEVFSLKEEEVKDYTYNINKSVEDKNIKILFKSIMFDDGKLIIDTNIDDTKFNPFKDFTKQQQRDWFVDKWGDEETRISLGADSTEIYLDGIKRTYFNNSAPNLNDKNEDGTTDVLIEQSIDVVESDKSNSGLEKVGENQFPNNIDINKMYNFKIKINKLHISESEYTQEESKVREGSYGGVVEGDWSINIDIKGEDLVNASTKYEINKDIELNLEDRKIDITVDNISLSPIYLGLDYSYIEENGYSVKFKVFNDKGEEYQLTQLSSDSYIGKTDKSNSKMKLINSGGDIKYIKIIPTIIDYEKKKTTVLEDEAIEIEINR